MEILEAGELMPDLYISPGRVPSGVISIPCRYVHSDSEMVDASDLENGVKLLLKILEDEIDIF